MARLRELFVICFLSIGVVCPRSIDSSEGPGDYEGTPSLTIGSNVEVGVDAHDKYPDAEHRLEASRVSPIAKKILQSAASVVKIGEQDPASDSEDRADSLKHSRAIRSPPEILSGVANPPSPNRYRCLLKICLFLPIKS